MKTKIFKRITAAMLAAVMTVTSVSASAESNNFETSTVYDFADFEEYINDTKLITITNTTPVKAISSIQYDHVYDGDQWYLDTFERMYY